MVSKTQTDTTVVQAAKKYGPTQASLQAQSENFYRMFSKGGPYRTLVSDQMYYDIYLEIRSEEVRILTAENPGTIHSTHVFSEGYFQEINLHSNHPVGIVLRGKLQRDRMGMLQGDARLELQGEEDSTLVEGLVASDGKTQTWKAAPDEQDEVAGRFNISYS